MCYSVQIRKLDLLNIEWQSFVDESLFNELKFLPELKPKMDRQTAWGGRIFPNSFAPVIVSENGTKKIVPMRYQMWPGLPGYGKDPQHLSLFNARRDTLLKPGGLWRHMLGRKHGILVFERFYEWVEARDVISAGRVSLEEIKRKFELQELEKKKKALSLGKPYKPTPTALKPAIERKVEISFQPSQREVMWAPVIYDERRLSENFVLRSFALLTDEPTPEVAAAGHDRSPIFLRRDLVETWLSPQGLRDTELVAMLGDVEPIYFQHQLAEAA